MRKEASQKQKISFALKRLINRNHPFTGFSVWLRWRYEIDKIDTNSYHTEPRTVLGCLTKRIVTQSTGILFVGCG